MSVFRSALLELEQSDNALYDDDTTNTRNTFQNLLDYGYSHTPNSFQISNVVSPNSVISKLKIEDERIYDILAEYNDEIDRIRSQYTRMLEDAKEFHSDVDRQALKNLMLSFDALQLEINAKLPEVASIKDTLTVFSQSIEEFALNNAKRWETQSTMNNALTARCRDISENVRGLFTTHKNLISSLSQSYVQLVNELEILRTNDVQNASLVSDLTSRITKIEQSDFMLTNQQEINAIAAVANKVVSDVEDIKDSISVVKNFKEDLSSMKNEMRLRIASKDRHLSQFRDLLYLTSFSSATYLSNIFIISAPLEINPNIMDVFTHYRSMAVVFELGQEFGVQTCEFNQGTSVFLRISQDRNNTLSVTFPFSEKDNVTCTKTSWKNDSIPLIAITFDSHETDISETSPNKMWISVHIMDGIRNTKETIKPTIIKQTTKLTLPINYSTGGVLLNSNVDNFRPYFIRMISSIIAPECCIDAVLHHRVRVKLNDLILTSHSFEDDYPTNPLLQVGHDIEMLKRTTVRSRYGYMYLSSAMTHEHKPLISLNLTPSYDGTSNKIPLSISYDVSADDRLGPDRKWSGVLSLGNVPSSTTTLTPVFLQYDGDGDPAMKGIMSCGMKVNITEKHTKMWWSTNPSGTTADEDVMPEFNKFKPECGQSTNSVHTMIMHFRTKKWIHGYEFLSVKDDTSHPINITLRIPVSVAIPSVALTQHTGTVTFRTRSGSLFSGTVNWQAVNIVQDGSQSVELRGNIDLVSSAASGGFKIIVLAGKVEPNAWSSVQVVASEYDKPRSSYSLKMTNGTVSLTSTPRTGNPCITWDDNVITTRIDRTFNVGDSEGLVKHHPDYENAIFISGYGMTHKRFPVYMQLESGSIRCGFLQDPIGMGNVALVDYEKIKLAEQIQGLAVSVLNVQQSVNDQERRLAIIEKMFEAHPPSTLQNILNTVISIGSVIAPYLGALANIAFHLLAVNVRMTELVASGINQTSLSQIVYEMYLTVSVIRLIRNDNSQLAAVNKRIYDISRTASNEITKRIATYKTIREAERLEKKSKVTLPSGMKIEVTPSHTKSIASDIEHIVRPLDNMKLAGSKFDQLASKVQAGTASNTESLLFHKLRDIHLLPMHNYLKMTNYEGGGKNINILGVSDGYAANYGGKITTHLLGNNSFQALKMKADGAGGLGVWKMKLEKKDNEWELTDPRKSGMTDYEILCAVGVSHTNATELLSKTNKDSVDKMVKWAYEEKSKEYLQADKHYSVKQKQILLLPGQFEAVHSAIRASSGAYNYTLVRNNCQKFTDDILKMLSNTAYRPKWMSNNVHTNYVHNLESILTSSEA